MTTTIKAATPCSQSVRALDVSFKSVTASVNWEVTALPLGTFALSAVSVANYPILPIIILGVTR